MTRTLTTTPFAVPSSALQSFGPMPDNAAGPPALYACADTQTGRSHSFRLNNHSFQPEANSL